MTTAWVAGGSGLVGGELLRRLLEDPSFTKVVAVGRRLLRLAHPKLVEAVVDFADPAAFAGLGRADVALSALGTTIKKAGSRPAFRAVDHDAVVAFARAAREAGARAFVHVTALGADASSPFFYNAVKGEVEASVARLGFERAVALRPSLLDGPRAERRLAESASLALARALGPLLGKYRPTPVSAVADAMIAAAKGAGPRVHVIEARDLVATRPR
ncbi:MAG: NAD(P)H-binding protein [Anaeromyxobacteraceae bacterium]